MDSPLLEPRPGPTCPGLIAGADPHRLCFESLGPDHAADGLTQSPACNACRMLPRLSRRHRLEHFQAYYVSPEEAEDQDLEVVEMEEQDVAGEVPFVFAIPAGRAAPFVEEEDDKDASMIGASGSGVQEGPPHRSARQDFPAVMTMAAERVGLPLPPATATEAGKPPPSGVLRPGSTARFYGPVLRPGSTARFYGAAGLRFAPVGRYLAVCGYLTALSGKDRDDLLRAPVSTEGLLGSITSVTQRFSRLEEERVQLSRMLPLVLPRAPPQGRERGATVRRRERRRYRAPTAPVAPSTSSARPAEPAQYRHSRGRPVQPQQAPPEQRASGWGARPPGADWRWEEASRRREWLSPPRTQGRIPPPPSSMQKL